MNIAVYCGSLIGNDKVFAEAAKELGTFIAEHGHSLIFGANELGLMGVVADSVLEHGGRVIGVVPDIPAMLEGLHPHLTECIYTKDMSERKKKMIDMADAYVALPGGIGTLDEITEVVCLSQIGLHHKPCIFVNTAGFYEPVKDIFAMMERTGFAHPEGNGRVLFSDDIEEIGAYLEAR